MVANDYVMWYVIVQSWRLMSASLSPAFPLLHLYLQRQVEHTTTTMIKVSSVTRNAAPNPMVVS